MAASTTAITGIDQAAINPMPPAPMAGAPNFAAARNIETGKIAALGAQRQSAYNTYQQGLAKAQGEEAAKEEDTSKRLNVLTSEDIPEPPDFQAIHKDAHELAGMMLVLSALSGAVTRAPLTASMNNFSAAIKGMAEGRQQEAEEQFKQYEANLKKADVLHKKWQEKFNGIKEEIKAGRDGYRDLIAAMKTEFEFNDKQITQGVSDAKDEVKSLIDMGNAANKAHEEMLNRAEKMREHKETIAEKHQHDHDMLKMLEDRLNSQGGGKASVQQFTGNDGKVYTQTVHNDGSIVVHTPDGVAVDANISGYAPPKGGNKNADVRSKQVKASIINALRNVQQIQTKYGKSAKGSIFYGTETKTAADNLQRGLFQSALTNEQQNIDSALMSAAEETGMALAGGMKLAEGFRKFVQSQFPRWGQSDSAAEDKYRIIRENLDGTSMAWFNKLATDPSMFASKEEHDKFLKYVYPVATGKGGEPAPPAPPAPPAHEKALDPATEAILDKHNVPKSVPK